MVFEKLKSAWSHNWLSTWILFFVVAAAPFPFGSTSNTAIAFWCILLSVALTFLSVRGLQKPQFWLVGGLFVIIAGYGFVLHEQLSDHPWLAPYHPVWKKASAVLGVAFTPYASVVKNEPFFALGAPLANLMSLLLGLVVGSDRTRARQLILVIGCSGALYALYGVLSSLIEPAMLLWRDKTAYLGNVTGTFINRNTAATYFGSCSVIWLLILLESIHRKMPEKRVVWKQVVRLVSELPLKLVLPPFVAFLVVLTAMFLTQSRGGVGLSLLTMIVAFTIYLRQTLTLKSGMLIGLGAGVFVALGLLQFLGGRVNSRFDSQGLVDEGRIEAWRSTIRIILDYPWFGTGLGTFTWSFPPYRSPDISVMGVWDAAHSTPLELASEVGLPFTGLIVTGWIVMFAVLARGVILRRRDTLMPLAALSIAALALLHSTIDFTLQVPGYSIPFFSLFGAGLAQSFRSKKLTRNERESSDEIAAA